MVRIEIFAPLTEFDEEERIVWTHVTDGFERERVPDEVNRIYIEFFLAEFFVVVVVLADHLIVCDVFCKPVHTKLVLLVADVAVPCFHQESRGSL